VLLRMSRDFCIMKMHSHCSNYPVNLPRLFHKEISPVKQMPHLEILISTSDLISQLMLPRHLQNVGNHFHLWKYAQ